MNQTDSTWEQLLKELWAVVAMICFAGFLFGLGGFSLLQLSDAATPEIIGSFGLLIGALLIGYAGMVATLIVGSYVIDFCESAWQRR